MNYDQAVEWVSEWFPSLEDEAFEAKVQEVMAEMEASEAEVTRLASFASNSLKFFG